MLAWVSAGGDRQTGTVSVPRKLIADIEATPDTWKALREDIAEGLVVDFQRELLAA